MHLPLLQPTIHFHSEPTRPLLRLLLNRGLPPVQVQVRVLFNSNHNSLSDNNKEEEEEDGQVHSIPKGTYNIFTPTIKLKLKGEWAIWKPPSKTH
jgi:hypothetical protein